MDQIYIISSPLESGTDTRNREGAATPHIARHRRCRGALRSPSPSPSASASASASP
jgi:hypothetical protein